MDSSPPMGGKQVSATAKGSVGPGAMRIKAVAFDLDGTLYPNYKFYFHSIPFFLSHPRLVAHFRKIRTTTRTIRPIRNFRRLQAELLAISLRTTVETAAELIEREIYGKWESVFARVTAFPGAGQLLARLRGRGVKLAVISDLPVERKLRFLKLDSYFDCAFSAEETGYLKPNPEPFLALTERLGLAPGDVLYVGNNYKYDILGAKEVGMRSAHLTGKRVAGSRADLTFSSYGQLEDSILEHIAGS